MIPPFDRGSGNLPPGVFDATWDEFVDRYGQMPHRRVLLSGMMLALDALRSAGCRTVYINGSFVTSKEEPEDFDGCWEGNGVDLPLLARLAPTLFDLRPGRKAQKDVYQGELFPAEQPADAFGIAFVDYFQRDKYTGRRKGIIRLRLGDTP